MEQLAGRYRVKSAELAPLHRQASELLRRFRDVELKLVPRETNKGADALANRAIDEYKAPA